MRAYRKAPEIRYRAARHRAGSGSRWPFASPRKPAAILCMAVGIASCATIASSFTIEAQQRPQAASTDRTPRSVVDTAFLTLPRASAESAKERRPRVLDACNDFAFRFLNFRKCANSRPRHVARRAASQPS